MRVRWKKQWVQDFRYVELGPFNENHLALGCLKTQGFWTTVFLRVVPAPGLFEAREFEDNHPFGLPITFESLSGSTPYYIAAPVLLNRRRHELTILIKPGRVGNFEIDDEIGWHAVPFA